VIGNGHAVVREGGTLEKGLHGHLAGVPTSPRSRRTRASRKGRHRNSTCSKPIVQTGVPDCVLHNKNPLCPVSASTRPDRGSLPLRIFMPRVAEAHELAATRRPLREAKGQPLIEDCDVGPRDCVPMHARVRVCSRLMAQQTATTAVGLELGSHDDRDGTIGFDGKDVRCRRRARRRVRSKAITRAARADPMPGAHGQ